MFRNILRRAHCASSSVVSGSPVTKPPFLHRLINSNRRPFVTTSEQFQIVPNMLIVPPGPGVIPQVPSTTGYILRTLYDFGNLLHKSAQARQYSAQAPLVSSSGPQDFRNLLHKSAQARQYSAQAPLVSSSGPQDFGNLLHKSAQAREYSAQAPLVLSSGPPPAGSRKMKTELCFTNTQAGFVIHNLIPVIFQGSKLVRLCNDDDVWVNAWMPYIRSHVNALPWELLEVMNRHWYTLEAGAKDVDFWARRFLRHGVDRGIPVIDNYWEQTIVSAMPFFEENGALSLENLTKAFPRGTIQNCDAFRDGISRAANKQISVRFKKDEMQDVVLGEIKVLLEGDKLLDHPETKAGCDETGTRYNYFHFKGTNWN